MPSASSSSGGSKRPSYMHLAWSLGHLVVLLSTIWVGLGVVLFSNRATSYYIAYAGALLSWSIVVYKSLGVPSLSRTYVTRAAMDENVQYLVVAGYWFFNKPIYVTLLPFAIFSTFHSLTFIRTTILKAPPPAKKDASGKKSAEPAAAQQANQQADFQANLSKQIQTWVKRNYEAAMRTVALIEVIVIMGRITLGAFTFQNGFLHPIFYAHFLRLRYYLSPQTRAAFALVNGQIDALLPKLPPQVANVVNVVRQMIVRYSESIISPQQATGSSSSTSTPAAGAGAGAGAASSPSTGTGSAQGTPQRPAR